MSRWVSEAQVWFARPVLRARRLRRITARRPVVIDERRLDPQLQHVLFVMKLGARPMWRMSLREARAQYDRMPRMFDGPLPPGVAVSAIRVPGPGRPLPARVYRPPGVRRPPVLLYLHGGGGVIGSLTSHDGVCRRLAARSRSIVVHAAYRLAPEHPFPAAVEDALAAFEWVRSRAAVLGGDPDRVGIGGDSMGANLSAVVSQQRRNAGLPAPAVQLLVYPPTDGRRATSSLDTVGRGFGLDTELRDWFREAYLGGADALDPRISPLLAPELTGLCRSVVATAGYDPLRDEGDAYARALTEAGVDVRHLHFPELGHTFLQMTGVVPRAARAADEVALALRAAFDRA